MKPPSLRGLSVLFVWSGLLGIMPAGLASAQIRIGPPVRVDVAQGPVNANETTVATTSADPLVGLVGWNDFRLLGEVRTTFAVTRDGGNTWTETMVRAQTGLESTIEADPMTAFDPRTGTLWAGGISFGTGSMYAARLDPGAANFEPSRTIAGAGSFPDKGWMAAGPDPVDPGVTRVYAAYNRGVSRSSDMGDTWLGPVPLGTGLGFLPRVGPNGELYVAYWDLDARHFLRRSFDGGETFGPPITIVDRMDVYGMQDNTAVPGSFRVGSLQGLAVDQRTGHLYCVYPDTTSRVGLERDVDIYLTQSTDQGSTWSTPTVVNGDAPFEQDQFFPWIEVDDSGGLHVLFNDTRNNAQLDQDPSALIDTYYAYSGDNGQTWTESRLTPTSWSSAHGPQVQFVGDYIGLSVGGGRAIASYPIAAPTTALDVVSTVILHGPAQVVCQGILCPCGNDDPSGGCGNSGFDSDPSTGATLVGTGSPSVVADDLVLSVHGLAPGQFGLLFAGTGTDNRAAGDGRLCIGGALKRYPIISADASGRFQLGPGEIVRRARVASPSFAPTPGETWYYQAIYRDGTGPCGAGLNATNAVSVLWN